MTLRATVPNAEEANNQKVSDVIKIQKFTQMLEDIKTYLIKSNFGCGFIFGCPLIIVKTEKRNKEFIQAFFEEMENTIYYRDDENKKCHMFGDAKTKNDFGNTSWWSYFDEQDGTNFDKLKAVLSNYMNGYDIGIYKYLGPPWIYAKGDDIRCYIIFWNLFLAAMDDDIYNEQLATVAELAACFGFDEPMMRDWCRAVEYVFAGNTLSEDCDLECETVEGAKFFLHKEE